MTGFSSAPSSSSPLSSSPDRLDPQPAAQHITVLGSTGSVGTSTLEVIALHAQFSVYALTAAVNIDLMVHQCQRFKPQVAVMNDEAAATELELRLREVSSSTRVQWGEEALCEVAAAPEVDAVMAAIVGAAGLSPALAAVAAGKKVLLANKESLVMAGELFMQAARQSGAVVLPIDSEHNAIFQCLPPSAQRDRQIVAAQGIRKVILTASGGPFLHSDPATLVEVTPEQACKHPNWSMGRKISVDSATMMNKGLEFIEACYLFNLSPDQVEVLVHPQSVVHSMVEYLDGSVLAQLGSADMRVPIAHALAWPLRIASGAGFLDLARTADLQFMEPDLERFPCLALGIEAARRGRCYPAALNAANEIAVAQFLDRQLRFTDIPEVISRTLAQIACPEPVSVAMIRMLDAEARAIAIDVAAQLRG